MQNRILFRHASVMPLLLILVIPVAAAEPPRTVDQVDLERYMGR